MISWHFNFYDTPHLELGMSIDIMKEWYDANSLKYCKMVPQSIEPLIKPSSSSKVAEESAEDAPQRAVVMYSLFILLISNASIALQSALCLLQAKA